MRIIEREDGSDRWVIETEDGLFWVLMPEELADLKRAFAEVVIPWSPPTKPSEQLRELSRLGNLTSSQMSEEERDWWNEHPLLKTIGSRYDEWMVMVANWLEGLKQ